MTTPPVLDALFQALITGDQDALRDIEIHRAHECVNLRALISTEHAGAVALDLGLGLASSVYVTPIFEGPCAFFMSRQVSVQARLTGGQTTVPLDYSLSFDSNFAEKLRATLSGEHIQPADRNWVLEVLMLKANNARVQFDVLPFLYENLRLARSNEENQRPLNTLIAFRMLNHLNWSAFNTDPSRFDFGVSPESLRTHLRPDAEAFLAEAQTSTSVMHHEAKSLGIQALLLRFATLWHERKPVPQRILSELLDFSLSKLGFLPVTELSLIWSGINRKVVAPFFGPITGQSKTMLKDIQGMAWDMTHLRLMEQTTTLSRFESFFVPYFISMDERWRNLLRLNPIRLMLIDDSRKSMLFARANELDFQLACNACASTLIQTERSPEKVAARRAVAKAIDVQSMRELVAREEHVWL
ncbi:hypothetical protein [Achromobacter xylosoxidans]|uniref:hypothetical protein n=1 Tax=Alcaligenes xylosoxydans xylosoxydans TaxID=85698 RepID=UPI0005DA182B|nr:hypothetical protein [Achromobacter xylosoxidans]QKQ52231.1 hypothetical protein FOC83_04250 [Achromobacter xylosoxidans]QPR92888.1 hypothetical protein I6G72_19755 [Achromobacter xylosoxidans]UON42567.1 hypothetical protein IUJ48_10885 [Achromobacter xylosoxidans]CKH62907.1 Uncharacterised protein [Achromobacter xylosoxidans]SQG74923.1 Uncharacterised protein [Achromobacter xylosoxidans]